MEQDRVLGGDAPGADDAVPLLEVGDDGAFDLDAMPAEDAAPPAPPPSTAAAGARGGVRSARLRGGGGGGGGGGGDSGAEKTFESCKTFSGNRDGWVFKLGGRGIGYYKDRGPAQPGMGAAASSAYYHFASTGEKHASKWDSYDVEAEMAKVDVDSAEEDSGEEGGGGGGGAEEVSRASFGAKQAKAKAKAKAAKAKAEEAVRRERSAEHDKRSALEQARDDAACPGRSPEQCEMVAQVMVLSDAQVGGMPPAQRAQVEPMRAMERRRLAALAEASKVPGRSHEQAQAIAQCMCLTEEQLCEMPEEQQDMIRNMRSNEGARLKRMAQGGAAELSPEAAMAEARAKAKCEGRTEEQVDAIARVMSMTEAEVRALDDPKQREQVESMRQMEGQRQAAEDALSAPGGPKGQPKLTPEQEAAKTAAAHAAQWEKYVAGKPSSATYQCCCLVLLLTRDSLPTTRFPTLIATSLLVAVVVNQTNHL